MQTIILAAGLGRRLGELTNGDTKCMLEINGKKLIDRFFDAILCQPSISRVIIVVGYKAQNVIDYINNKNYDIEIVYVENKDYAITNNIYSLSLAANYLELDDTLLFESDLIYDRNIVDKILSAPYPNLALVDKYESWMDGTVVKIDRENNIKSFVPTKYFDYGEVSQYYKTVNIYKFSKEFSRKFYVPFMKAYLSAFGDNEYYEQVLRVLTLLDNIELKALPLNGEKWYEIDDIQDFDIAESMFAQNDKEQWEKYSSRYGGYWRYPSLKDYCYLVNPYFPPTQMVEEIKSSFETLLREYPSGMRVNSMLAAKYFNVKSDYIVVGNGAAELIKGYMENYVGKLGLTFPTFEEYPNRLPKEKVEQYVPRNQDFAYTSQDLISYFENKDIDTLLLINPDNPSGNYVSFAEMLTLIEWSAKKEIKIIVDESFVDFANVSGDFSLLNNDILKKFQHLIVVKSISKSYGVPGLRLGVLASGNKELISKLKKEIAIWNINSFSEFYMQIFGKYEKEYIKACQLFIEEREFFYKELHQIDYMRVIPSQGNYFMCELINGVQALQLAVKLLKDYNILIKDCSTKAAFKGSQYIRLAVRDRNDNHTLSNILKSITPEMLETSK